MSERREPWPEFRFWKGNLDVGGAGPKISRFPVGSPGLVSGPCARWCRGSTQRQGMSPSLSLTLPHICERQRLVYRCSGLGLLFQKKGKGSCGSFVSQAHFTKQANQGP